MKPIKRNLKHRGEAAFRSTCDTQNTKTPGRKKSKKVGKCQKNRSIRTNQASLKQKHARQKNVKLASEQNLPCGNKAENTLAETLQAKNKINKT